MHTKLLASLLAVASLSACSASAKGPDLTPGGAFDPAKDRERVLHCTIADLSLGEIGAEVLSLDTATWQASDQAVGERFNRLKPFMAAIEKAEGKAAGGLTTEAARAAGPYVDGYRARALLGDKAKLFAEAVDETARCDALVRSWGAPPAS